MYQIVVRTKIITAIKYKRLPALRQNASTKIIKPVQNLFKGFNSQGIIHY